MLSAILQYYFIFLRLPIPPYPQQFGLTTALIQYNIIKSGFTPKEGCVIFIALNQLYLIDCQSNGLFFQSKCNLSQQKPL